MFRAAWAAGQAGPSHMWFAVGPALTGLGLEGLPRALFAVRPQGWRDEPRRRIARGVLVLTHGAAALRKEYGAVGGLNFVSNCQTDYNHTQRVPDRIRCPQPHLCLKKRQFHIQLTFKLTDRPLKNRENETERMKKSFNTRVL